MNPNIVMDMTSFQGVISLLGVILQNLTPKKRGTKIIYFLNFSKRLFSIFLNVCFAGVLDNRYAIFY